MGKRLYGLIATAMLTLTGCGPVYKVVHDYEPPQTPQGMQCVRDCEQDRQNCRYDCERSYNYCMEDARGQAEQSYADAKDRYIEELQRYNDDLEDMYREQRHAPGKIRDLREERAFYAEKCRAGKDKACDKKKYIDRQIDELANPTHPTEPSEPSYEDELARYQGQCSNECGCDDHFNNCYAGCGGRVTSRKVCVDNCE